jgi:catechol 2,3-dioxygenase-like lactoylglutathione lyase family enzyme
MIHSLHHLSIATPDVDAAGAAYATLLGRAPDGDIEADGTRQAWFSTSNIRLALVAPTGAGTLADAARKRLSEKGEGLWEIAFAVDDLARTTNLFERRALAPGAEFSRAIKANGVASLLKASRLGAETTHGVDLLLVEVSRATGSVGERASLSGLDHIVIRSPDPGRAVELYGGRLGLDLRLDRSNPAWGARLLFFRCGDLVVEIVHDLKSGVSDAPDVFGGLSWRAGNLEAARERLVKAGLDLSDIRKGRRPGSHVCTVRDGTCGVPTILLGLDG